MRIAVLELSSSHEECLFSQISFLQKEEHHISLFIHPNIEKQISYGSRVDTISTINFDKEKWTNSIRSQYRLAKNLSQFDKLIFNTASSSKELRNILLLLLFSNVECIGVLHNTKKLQKSFTQKIISLKIKKYFILSDSLKEKAIVPNSKIKLESFYPIFFPEFKVQYIEKKENEVWFCIPGRVEFSRRDYYYLIDQFKENKVSNNLKFVILGNINTKDGLEFKSELERLNLDSYFIIFNEFIDNNLYYNYIEKSDFILPLLKKEDTAYLNYKISGTFNLAYGFKKIILFNEFYKGITDLNENGIFYSKDNFSDKINNINDFVLNNAYSGKKWHYDFQCNKYLNFIKS